MVLNKESSLVKILGISLRILSGSLFVFSGFSKLFPIEFFEYQLVGDHVATWNTAGYLSRLLISLEFFIGVSLLLNIDYKKIIVKTAFLLTVFFTVYLLFILLLKGNEPNCNCFGEMVKMSVASSLLKNSLLLIIFTVIWKIHDGYSYRFPRIILSSFLVISIATIFIINPISKTFANAADLNDVNFKIDLGFLYTDSQYVKPKVDLMKGKHIISFLSLTCPHCRLAALKFGVMTKNNPNLPVYFILNGDSDKLKSFFEETKSAHIPSNIVKGNPFIVMSGLSLPAIYFVNNGLVEKRSSYITLNEDTISNWLKKTH